jgi:hypothetical protein
VLKVPEVVGQRAAATGAAAAAAAGNATAASGTVAPAAGAATPPPVRPVPIATAVVSPGGTPVDGTGTAATAIPQLDKDALSALSPGSKRFGRASARLGHVPWWMRFVLWVIAVPLGFFVVFFFARMFNFFTSNQLSDLFLANNPGRFWPAARLLPFVALVTAAIVQLGVYLLARWRGRRAGAAGVGVGVGVGEVSGSRSRSRRV